MCGIFLSIASHSSHLDPPGPSLVSLLDNRGPDSRQNVVNTLTHNGIDLRLSFYSTVLSLRGREIVTQPLQDDATGCKLCWNGEAWRIGNVAVGGNDAQAVFQLLLKAVANIEVRLKNLDGHEEHDRVSVAADPIVRALNSIAGPFAFVFYDRHCSRIYFGRDPLGRRSLLFKTDVEGFKISSVSDGTAGWSEVPADGIYALCFNQQELYMPVQESWIPQTGFLTAANACLVNYPYKDYDRYPIFNHSLPSKDRPTLGVYSEAVIVLETLLRTALSIRTEDIPLVQHHTATVDNRVMLSCHSSADTSSQKPLNNSALEEATSTHSHSAHSPRLAILFSGGLDCTVLARIIHELLPADEDIDLLNVAFHNPRVHDAAGLDLKSAYESCPDRITARSSHTELCQVCPTRTWRLVEIDVPYTEALAHRSRIVSLMNPHDTEMDLSIAFALYFAARGIGQVEIASGAKCSYTTPARVLFSGLGADELFGGYQRHATAFGRNGFASLLAELELDINRLGKRNLGRDDRVISHWSKEARYPYLDEDLVKWAVTAPIWEKCGFGRSVPEIQVNVEASIEPGKQVLRLLALRLRMGKVAREKKRAIQFGARTAKMEGRTKGTQQIL